MSKVEIKPLSGCGADILGVDIPNMSADEIKLVKQTFADHGLVLFRGQNLS